MSGLGRFRFRSPERDRESDECRLGLIRMVARSAIADAEAEAMGLRARIAEARRSAIFLVQQVDAGESIPRPEFSNSAKQLLAIEQRLAQLEDHLTALRNWSGASTVSLISHACLLSGPLVRDPQGEMLLTSARDFEIFRRGLASIRDFLVLDDLTLIQTGQTGLLDGRDVNEDIFPTAAFRLNEPVSFFMPVRLSERGR
jgi:hypothetical protein